NPGTPVSALKPYLKLVDMVLIMSVEPGFGGQKFIEGTYDKIEELKRLRDEMRLYFDIEVDGGVTASNLADIVRAGVNVIVSGSSIFKGDIAANVKNFKKIIAVNAD
ncbi:MAG: ribulose-phosphate 3-epimerase, partial [Bacteroidales bacterium]|nr:ribulose-phosphate 3-epimerase [Bacteroidales bacterium]